MASTERVLLSAPAILPRGRTPAVDQFFVAGEDNLRVTVFHRFAFTTRVDVTWRLWLEADRTVQVNAESVATTTYPTASSELIKLDRGVLLNVQIAVPSGVFVRQGTLFARGEIVRGLSGAVIPLATILQGYVASQNVLAWPGTPIHGMHDGRGVILSQTWTNAVGPLSSTIIVFDATRWQIVSGRLLFTASANVGDRIPTISILDAGGFVLFQSITARVVVAGETIVLLFGAGLTQATGGLTNWLTFNFPNEIELSASAEVRVEIQGELAGDTLTGNRALVREWMDR